MGIKGLNTWISASFPGVMLKGKGALGAVYEHVLFDANGIVHQAMRKRATEKDVMRVIVNQIDDILKLFPATRSVLVALDGPGPTAKLMEQRKRRIDKVLKGARDAEALIPGSAENLRRLELARLEGRPPPKPKSSKRKSSDSLQVTPGTAFMLRLRRALEWWATSRLLGVGGVFKPHTPIVLVSAADVGGEGELKLLQHLHAVLREPRPPHEPPPSFLLVGPDADLLLLALASGTPRCDVLTTDAEGGHQLFRTHPLTQAFARSLGAPSAPPAAAAGDEQRVRFGELLQLDFLVVAFLQGNDRSRTQRTAPSASTVHPQGAAHSAAPRAPQATTTCPSFAARSCRACGLRS